MSQLSEAEAGLTKALRATREVAYRVERLFKGCGMQGQPDGAVGQARVEGLAHYYAAAATVRDDLAAAVAAYAAAANQAEVDPTQRIADANTVRAELDRVEAAARTAVPA